jgi:hypothetical protein
LHGKAGEKFLLKYYFFADKTPCTGKIKTVEADYEKRLFFAKR